MADSRICSIPGCGKPLRVKSRGWCNLHYRRWQRHGDPTAGHAYKGEPLRFFHSVMDENPDHCVFWPYGLSHGYGRVVIDGKNMATHRAACIIAHGPPPTPKHEAAHTCGKGGLGCFVPRHVRWATREENEQDKKLHGTDNRGERHPLAILSDETARQIKLAKGTRLEIAKRFGVKKDVVRAIKVGRLWKHV